jgi:hypothetical protein
MLRSITFCNRVAGWNVVPCLIDRRKPSASLHCLPGLEHEAARYYLHLSSLDTLNLSLVNEPTATENKDSVFYLRLITLGPIIPRLCDLSKLDIAPQCIVQCRDLPRARRKPAHQSSVPAGRMGGQESSSSAVEAAAVIVCAAVALSMTSAHT